MPRNATNRTPDVLDLNDTDALLAVAAQLDAELEQLQAQVRLRTDRLRAVLDQVGRNVQREREARELAAAAPKLTPAPGRATAHMNLDELLLGGRDVCAADEAF